MSRIIIFITRSIFVLISLIKPSNLPYAIILPANETLPITKPKNITNACQFSIPYLAINSLLIYGNSINEIKAAAAPPIPLKKETSSGIFVILTLRATTQPNAVPKAIAVKIYPKLPILCP